MSNFAKGLPPRGPEILDPAIHRSISAYERVEEARDVQARYPKLGSYLAEIEVAEDDPDITFRKTSRPESSHYSLRGEPLLLVHRVRTVIPCEPGTC